MPDNKLLHYGIKRRSGRYPWGSGDEAYQGDQFIRRYETLKLEGKTGTEIAKELGLTTTELRNNITWARKEQRTHLANSIERLRNDGMTKTAIANELGISEASVRNYLSTPVKKHQTMQLESVNKALEDAVNKSEYLDVGIGVELQLGVPRNRFNAVVNKMVKEDGYYIHEIYVKRLNDPLKPTTIKVLTKEPDMINVRNNADKIRPLDSWSDDRGETIHNLAEPKAYDPNKVKIRYKEQGGESKDGVIELRPGVEDLDMGASRYAQVRIKVGEDRFLKGMAVYGDPKDFPPGVDIIFNTNKPLGTTPRDVMKKTKSPEESDNIFGSTIKPTMQNKSRVLNVVNEEGDWDTWSATLPSQFLGKQSTGLIKDRLDATSKSLKMELDEISGLTNPIVKQHLLEAYSNNMNSKAARLAAKGLPRTKSHVILPFPDMKPDEIYAPHYKNGEKVVLVRYPHAGVFEIPEVTINNKNPQARKILGMAPDAIGIHPSIAKKLSGADFDGDTVYVIPNPGGPLRIKTSRSLKELKNFDPMDYKVGRDTISKRHLQTEMGLASNLITDMTIKGATPSEIARAVKHSMVVIDSYKHKLDYKKSKEDNGISALRKKYQSHISPDTGKKTTGGSTLLSRSKRKIDLDQAETVRELAKDRVLKDGTVKAKGMEPAAIAKKLKISESAVKGYIAGKDFDPEVYSSGTERESLYVAHIRNLQSLKNTANKLYMSVKPPKYDKDAAKVYKPEVESLNAKLIKAKENAPRERQAQILSNKLYYATVSPEMDDEQKAKLKSRSLARARVTVGASKGTIDIDDNEWEAIQAKAISNTKLKEILMNADMDRVKQLATPRTRKLNTAKAQKAQTLLDSGYTYAEVSSAMGISTSAIRSLITGNE